MGGSFDDALSHQHFLELAHLGNNQSDLNCNHMCCSRRTHCNSNPNDYSQDGLVQGNVDEKAEFGAINNVYKGTLSTSSSGVRPYF